MGEFDYVDESLKQLKEVADRHIKSGEFDADKLTEDFMNIDAFRDMKAYLQSEENQREIQPFEALNQEFVSLHAQYKIRLRTCIGTRNKKRSDANMPAVA